MATSIFFTESKDFKLIRDRILNMEDNYLVYVYADTTNIRIPKELIMQLPRYGNNLIWVDTADMDSADLSHHIVLTIGQLLNPEEEIDFYIVSKSSKLEKTIFFLRNQGIPAEMVGPAEEKPKAEKKSGKRGRPRKAKSDVKATVKTGKRGRPKKEQVVVEEASAPVKTGKRGRPKKAQEIVPAADTVEAPRKKRGRPSLAKAEITEAKPVKKTRKKKAEATEAVAAPEVKKAKKAKKVKEAKPRKQRIDKEITEAMVQEKLAAYPSDDNNLTTVLQRLFNLKKVARPRFAAKLIELIKDSTLEDDTTAERIITGMQNLKVIEATSDGRIFYKD
jgi:hypothetical protein